MTKYLLLLLSFISSYTSSDVKDSKNVHLGSRYIHPSCSRSEICSPWYYCHEGQCKLGELPPHDILKVDGRHISVLDNTCVTYNNHLMEAGYCIYNFIHGQNSREVYYQLPKDISELNEVMCGAQFNRTGTLCIVSAQMVWYIPMKLLVSHVQMASLTGGSLCWLLFFLLQFSTSLFSS